MPYATKQDLIDRFGEEELIQLTDRNTPQDAIDDVVVQRALDDADALIDSYLVARYTLPLTPVPGSLNPFACDIARYQLFADGATEMVTQRYKDAVKWLTNVANGVASLGIDSSGAAPAQSGSTQFVANPRVFSSCTLNDYANK